MKFLDYKESLGLAIDDKSKRDYFFIKIFNVLNIIEAEGRFHMNDREYFVFCNTSGVTMYTGELYGQGYSYVLKELKKHTTSLQSFLPYYIAFINCLEDLDYRQYNRKSFLSLISGMLEESKIPFEIRRDGDECFVFPRGAKELDDALVSQNLEWLNEYPKSRVAFVKALTDYSNQNTTNASEVADKFRKALESFFQEFFDGEKSLENYKSEYGSYLKQHNVPTEISNNFESLLQAYTNYINNYAKHHDKVSSNVLEYIMYQTGNIIRLLITLEKE